MPHAKPRGGPTPPRADKRPHRAPAPMASHGATTTPGSAPTTGARCCAIPQRCPPTSARCLEAENAYADEILGPTRALQRQLVREMRARLKEDDSEVPQSDGPFAYYSRFRHGGQHRIFCRRPRGGRQGNGPARRRRARRRQAVLPPARARAIRPIIGHSPGAPTTRARRCTRFACATSPPTPTSPTASRTPPAKSCGRAIRAPSSMSRRTRTIAPGG